jgi:uncharacterized protein YPO0396
MITLERIRLVNWHNFADTVIGIGNRCLFAGDFGESGDSLGVPPIPGSACGRQHHLLRIQTALPPGLYRFYKGQSETTVRLVMFDEAFNRMDGERIGKILKFYQGLNIQIISSSLPKKSPKLSAAWPGHLPPREFPPKGRPFFHSWPNASHPWMPPKGLI